MDCVCAPFRGCRIKTKYLSSFERGMVVGDRRTGLSVSRTAMLLGFSHSTVSCVDQERHNAYRTSSQLHRTVGSIGVNMGQYPCWTLSTPCRVHARTNWGCSEGKRVVFLMFCLLNVHPNTQTLYTQTPIHTHMNTHYLWTTQSPTNHRLYNNIGGRAVQYGTTGGRQSATLWLSEEHAVLSISPAGSLRVTIRLLAVLACYNKGSNSRSVCSLSDSVPLSVHSVLRNEIGANKVKKMVEWK